MAFSIGDIIKSVIRLKKLITIFIVIKLLLAVISITCMKRVSQILEQIKETEGTQDVVVTGFLVFAILNIADNIARELVMTYYQKFRSGITIKETIRIKNELLQREKAAVKEELKNQNFETYIDRVVSLVLNIIDTGVRSLIVIYMFPTLMLYSVVIFSVMFTVNHILNGRVQKYIKQLEKERKIISTQRQRILHSFLDPKINMDNKYADLTKKIRTIDLKNNILYGLAYRLIPVFIGVLDGIVGFCSLNKESFGYYISASNCLWNLGYTMGSVMCNITELRCDHGDLIQSFQKLENKKDTTQPVSLELGALKITNFKYELSPSTIRVSEKSTAILNKIKLEKPFSMQRDSLYCIYGKSGSGKTTFAKLFVDELYHDQLTCQIEDSTGKRVGGAPAPVSLSRFTEYMEQDNPDVFPSESCHTTLNEFLDQPPGFQLGEWIKDLGLDDKFQSGESEVSDNISKGQKNRITLLRVLLRASNSSAPILVLDEPDNGLDRENCKKLLVLLKKMAKGRIILMICHNVDILNDSEIKKIEVSEGIIQPEF